MPQQQIATLYFTTKPADSSGTITFSNSDWPAGAFTVEEEAPPAGSITGEIRYVNQTSLEGAKVSLYYQNNTYTGKYVLSDAGGKFQFDNIANGSYYVNVTKKAGYESAKSSVFTVTSSASTIIGAVSLIHYDITNDNTNGINILDLNPVGQHFEQRTIKPYPIYDVNGDGVVDIVDLAIILSHFGESFEVQPGSAP